MSSLRGILAITALCAGSMAQTLSPANYTSGDSVPWVAGEPVLSVSTDEKSAAPLVALGSLITPAADPDLPAAGLSGLALLANATTSFLPDSNSIALISCDTTDYTGYVTAASLIQQAVTANITAVVAYSRGADYCEWQGTAPDGYPWLYTMKVLNNTQTALHQVSLLQNEAGANTTYITLGPYGSQTSNGGATTTSNSAASTSTAMNNPGGPPPSTRVAMVILYAITGIITILFLAIIITGAVRAHRHPDRYGPRNTTGGPRQSRARGLARAMLDGLPIVKVGERAESKPGDVELAGGGANVDSTRLPESGQVITGDSPESAGQVDSTTEQHKVVSTVEGTAGIADHVAAPVDGSDSQGCSICTEDFETGQDQRVLPCDHRFHPACIDPWLLNVSGTCPLCRIDLRPRTSNSYDEDGSPVSQAGEDAVGGMAPPLALVGGTVNRERLSVRRSIMLSIIGMGQPERMSRHQRVSALRDYRRRRQSADAQQSEVAVPEALPDEELSTRIRLRNAFRVRTRRTGQTTNEPGQSANNIESPT